MSKLAVDGDVSYHASSVDTATSVQSSFLDLAREQQQRLCMYQVKPCEIELDYRKYHSYVLSVRGSAKAGRHACRSTPPLKLTVTPSVFYSYWSFPPIIR